MRFAATLNYSSRMSAVRNDWEKRVEQLWAELDRFDGDEFVRNIENLVGELPPGAADGLFERGAAFDSTSHPDRAVPLYEAALEAGLLGERRRRAVIQLSSSLRNLGRPHDALRLLTAEADHPSDHLDGAVATFLAVGVLWAVVAAVLAAAGRKKMQQVKGPEATAAELEADRRLARDLRS